MCNTFATGPRETENAGTTPGGATPCKSKWDVDDMVGNVWEWVGDWDDRALGGCTDWTTSVGIAGGNQSCVGGDESTADALLPGALVRGGSWGNGANAGVFAVNGSFDPSSADNFIGFRCGR